MLQGDKKIYLTGTTGMVGSYISSMEWPAPIVRTTHADFDIAEPAQVDRYFKDRDDVGVIVHMAAETDVDRCEKDFDHAFRMNVIGTQNLVYQAIRFNVPLLYVSTVGVFGGDGSLGPFHEFSAPNPANRYGLSKLYGEHIVRNHVPHHFIVRAGWMMGGVEKDKKFVMKIIQQIKQGRKELFAIGNIVGSPTYAKELLQIISRLIQTDWWGTYHCTNNGKMSRYEIAKMIAQELDPSVSVTSVGSEYFNLDAPRALSEHSDNRMLTARGLNTLSSVEEALRLYLLEIKGSEFWVAGQSV